MFILIKYEKKNYLFIIIYLLRKLKFKNYRYFKYTKLQKDFNDNDIYQYVIISI